MDYPKKLNSLKEPVKWWLPVTGSEGWAMSVRDYQVSIKQEE